MPAISHLFFTHAARAWGSSPELGALKFLYKTPRSLPACWQEQADVRFRRHKAAGEDPRDLVSRVNQIEAGESGNAAHSPLFFPAPLARMRQGGREKRGRGWFCGLYLIHPRGKPALALK
jgi:hypothetical protein